MRGPRCKKLLVTMSQSILFTILSLTLYIYHALGGIIVLRSDIAAAAVSQSADPAEATDISIESLRISVSDDGDIDIDLPLVVRNEIGFILKTEPNFEAQTEQIQELMI